MDYKYTGIILGKRDIGEADRIYSIYTLEAGKIQAKAIGVRRLNAKLAGHLETATLAEIFTAKTKGIGKITAATALNYFAGIKKNLEAVSKVFYVFSRLDKIIFEQEKDEKIFRLLEKYLEVMEKLSAGAEDGEKMDIITLGFLFKFLEETGYKMETGKCVDCGNKLRPQNNYFSAEKGGILCENCENRQGKRISISSESVKMLRIFSKNKLESLVKLRVPEKEIKNLKIIAEEAIGWI
ncbi:MAG: DNA repair protein RecO [Parcubacteria group bacterium]